MFSFHHPEYLWALLLVPLLLFLLWQRRQWQLRQIRTLADPDLQSGLWSDSRSRLSAWAPALLPIGALASLALAAAGPYEPKGGTPQPSKGVDVFIALDASRSMNAQDVQPSRLNRAFSFINRLTEYLDGDRIGLVVFAGRAYLQVPLTTDRSAFRLALQSTAPEALPTQGTVLSRAFDMAASGFADNQRRSRALVIVTDGEDHDEGAPASAAAAQEAGIQLFGIGVGTPQGIGLQEADGSPKLGPNGEQVITKLGEESLRTLMTEHGGQYRRLQDAAADARAIADAIKKLPATVLKDDKQASAKEYFPYLAALALGFLLVQLFLQSARRPRRAVAAVALLAGLFASGKTSAQSAAWQQGDRLYRAGKFAEAIEAYKKALGDSATRAAAQYNLGNALYRKGDFAAAAQAFEQAAQMGKNADAHYNAGNSLAEQKKWQEALQAYKQALRKQPGSADAQRNYAYARKQVQRQQQQEKQNQQPREQPQQQQERQEQKANPSNLSKEQAEKMLQALRQEEQKIGERKKENTSNETPPAKDW